MVCHASTINFGRAQLAAYLAQFTDSPDHHGTHVNEAIKICNAVKIIWGRRELVSLSRMRMVSTILRVFDDF